jgi:hypothetical protein
MLIAIILIVIFNREEIEETKEIKKRSRNIFFKKRYYIDFNSKECFKSKHDIEYNIIDHVKPMRKRKKLDSDAYLMLFFIFLDVLAVTAMLLLFPPNCHC